LPSFSSMSPRYSPQSPSLIQPRRNINEILVILQNIHHPPLRLPRAAAVVRRLHPQIVRGLTSVVLATHHLHRASVRTRWVSTSTWIDEVDDDAGWDDVEPARARNGSEALEIVSIESYVKNDDTNAHVCLGGTRWRPGNANGPGHRADGSRSRVDGSSGRVIGRSSREAMQMPQTHRTMLEWLV